MITNGVRAPTALTFDAGGTLYVANAYLSRRGLMVGMVTKYLPGSNTPEVKLTGQLTIPASLALDSAQNLYVANFNLGEGDVVVFAPGKIRPIQEITNAIAGPRAVAISN